MEALATAVDAIDRHLSQCEAVEETAVNASSDSEDSLILSLCPHVQWGAMLVVVSTHMAQQVLCHPVCVQH